MDVAKARVWRCKQALLISLPMLLGACANNNSSVSSATFPETTAACAATAVPSRYIIRWKDGTHSVVESTDRESFVRDYLEPYQDEVEFAEQDQLVQRSEPVPNPTSTSAATVSASATATATLNWGQAKVGAPTAWAQGIKGQGVIVAVIDSGVDLTHPQIAPRLAVNAGEIPNNKIDDDQNGYVDDVYGYDFRVDSGNVSDGTGHGTHVSGIILADHTTGDVQGMAPQAQLIPLDFMDNTGLGNIGDAITAMDYAVARGAKVINASWGGAPCSQALRKVIQGLGQKGVLFVSAAGNGGDDAIGDDIEQVPEYPASFGLSNQITVGASVIGDYMTSFSNFSTQLVHLMAPGQDIISTYPGNRTAKMDGTSMATPFVSGAAALLWSYRPTATVVQIRQAIFSGVDDGPFKVMTHGRLNVSKALIELQKLVP